MPEQTPPPIKNGFLTSEFAATLGVIATSILAILVTLGRLTPEQSASLGGEISKAIAGLVGVAGSVVVVWRFIQSRHDLKAKQLEASQSPKEPERG